MTVHKEKEKLTGIDLACLHTPGDLVGFVSAFVPNLTTRLATERGFCYDYACTYVATAADSNQYSYVSKSIEVDWAGTLLRFNKAILQQY